MLYCVNCAKCYGNQMQGGNTCHKCKTEVVEITNEKLLDLINGLTNALKGMETAATNPREIIQIAKVIEKGEKVFIKEYAKRKTQLEEIQLELSLIQSFSEKMGYVLEEETEEQTEGENNA